MDSLKGTENIDLSNPDEVKKLENYLEKKNDFDYKLAVAIYKYLNKKDVKDFSTDNNKIPMEIDVTRLMSNNKEALEDEYSFVFEDCNLTHNGKNSKNGHFLDLLNETRYPGKCKKSDRVIKKINLYNLLNLKHIFIQKKIIDDISFEEIGAVSFILKLQFDAVGRASLNLYFYKLHKKISSNNSVDKNYNPNLNPLIPKYDELPPEGLISKISGIFRGGYKSKRSYKGRKRTTSMNGKTSRKKVTKPSPIIKKTSYYYKENGKYKPLYSYRYSQDFRRTGRKSYVIFRKTRNIKDKSYHGKFYKKSDIVREKNRTKN